MNIILRALTAPYRWSWNLMLDTVLGPDQLRGRDWPSTTPDPLRVVESEDDIGYSTRVSFGPGGCPYLDCPVAGGTGELCDDDHCREW
jgi:hypothetical protein